MSDYITASGSVVAVRIPEFRGLWQYGDSTGADPRYATEVSGALTTQGRLRPMARCAQLAPELPSAVSTLALLYRRWHTEQNRHEVLIAASDGQLYWAYPDSAGWTKMNLPQDWPALRYQSDDWSYVTYEINPSGSSAPVDVLLMSNAKDGMICVRGDDMTVSAVATPKKFGVIARYAERIWGGAIEDDPDMLAYSAPYDPFDWEQNTASPEDGAGEVLQPSWDGDSFMALIPFGGQLLAFKRTRLWRILGTDPGTYVFREQYGEGVAWPDTAAADGLRILMLGNEGVLRYDGESVSPYQPQYAADVFARVNRMALDKACACMYRGTYYCALPLDGAQDNSAVLQYDTQENTWLLREDVRVESFLPTEEALYFTSATTPGRLWKWREDCLADGAAQPMRWVGPWCDADAQQTVKSGFTVYLTVECAQQTEVKLSMQTERKTQTKTLVCRPPREGGQPRQRRIPFSVRGRRFRLIVESAGEQPWQLAGGVRIEADLEAD